MSRLTGKLLGLIDEGYKSRSPDEQRFIDKHKIQRAKLPDVAGNGMDVYQGGGRKKYIKRQRERHGYDIGKDEAVYEEVELDEGIKRKFSRWWNRDKIAKNVSGKLDTQINKNSASRGKTRSQKMGRLADLANRQRKVNESLSYRDNSGTQKRMQALGASNADLAEKLRKNPSKRSQEEQKQKAKQAFKKFNMKAGM